MELDSFDIVEGLVIKGRWPSRVLNAATSLHGGLVAAGPVVTAKAAAESLVGELRGRVAGLRAR